jgi:hypothetical protein
VILSLLALVALIHFLSVTFAASPHFDIKNCTDLIRHTSYTKFVPFNSKTQIMDEVQYVDQLVGGQPAALVTVTETSQPARFDAYIYGCVLEGTTPTLTLLFKRQGLLQGSVHITQDNILSTSEQDTALTQDANTLQNPLQTNVYREYVWRNGNFVQVPFAGLYPVISRAEAEALQEEGATNGQPSLWNDPLNTTRQMARDLLQLENPRVRLKDNNGHISHVLLERDSPHLTLHVTLSHLLPDNNIWFVTQARSNGITLDEPPSPLRSPLSIKGTVTATHFLRSQAQSSISLFDHTLSPLRILNKPDLKIAGDDSYSGIILYTNNVANQPGLLLVKVQDGKELQVLLSHVLLG